MKILILGYIVRGPLGGLAWHHLQYVLGLREEGHDILFIEDSDNFESCYNPETNEMSVNPKYGLNFINELFKKFELENKWAYFDEHTNSWFGTSKEKVIQFCNDAEIVLNISGVNPLREWWLKIPNRVFIDTDPAFVQIRNLTIPKSFELAAAHNHFYSFGENIDNDNCLIPDDGFSWKGTRQPVFLPAWKFSDPKLSGKWTTVMQWDSYKSLSYEEKNYEMKSASFRPYESLPLLLPDEKFELASGSASVPHDLLKKNGWHVISSLLPTRDAWTYQKYINESKGEWSIAKQGYVMSNSGWFSERSLSYLASGKPVIVQDTGFSKNFEMKKGVFAFQSIEDILDAVFQINSDYAFQCKQARNWVEENFSSEKVLRKLLSGINS